MDIGFVSAIGLLQDLHTRWRQTLMIMLRRSTLMQNGVKARRMTMATSSIRCTCTCRGVHHDGSSCILCRASSGSEILGASAFSLCRTCRGCCGRVPRCGMRWMYFCGCCGLASKKCLLDFLTENSGGRESAASQRTDDDSCCFLRTTCSHSNTSTPALLPQMPPSRNLLPRLRVLQK